MIPINLVSTSIGSTILVEIKNGEQFRGKLVNCDVWMNLHLKEVICTSAMGEQISKVAECFVRGNSIKYLSVPNEIADKVLEHAKRKQEQSEGGKDKREKTKRTGANKKASERNEVSKNNKRK